MAGFAKLFSGITESSIWVQPHYVLRVWIAMLARADAEGCVEGSIPGFANLCLVSVEEMEKAVELLSAPDPYSRDPDNEGRRIRPFPGGWAILNHSKYRQMAQGREGSKAPYMREYRKRKREEAFGGPGDEVLDG
jgi:hypothetical protein